jgi:two-component system OmpR family response regulator
MSSAERDKRVLVVEDDLNQAALMRDVLEAHGYAVDSAMDGNRAITMACTNDYDAVLLDLGLPEYDGVEVLQVLRKRSLMHPMKVIVVTGDVAGTRKRDLNRAGIHAYLTKPVHAAVLTAELARVLRSGKAA